MVHPRLPDFDELIGGNWLLSGLEEHVLPVVPHFTGGRVEANRDIGGRLVAGFGDRFQNQFDGFFVRFQVGSETTFIAHGGRVSFAVQHLLQCVEGLDAHADRLGKRWRAVWRDHELLEVDGVVGMLAAVQHVHARHGKRTRVGAAQVAVQRQ